MSDLINKSKKELVEIIEQMKEKLQEVQQLEKELAPKESDLIGKALSFYKDSDGQYQKVVINYNPESLVARIDNIQLLKTKDDQVAMYLAKKHLVEDIMNLSQIKIFITKQGDKK